MRVWVVTDGDKDVIGVYGDADLLEYIETCEGAPLDGISIFANVVGVGE